MTAVDLTLPYHLPLQRAVGRNRGAAQHHALQGFYHGKHQADGNWLFADEPVLPGRPQLQPLLHAFALDVLRAREQAYAAGLPLDLWLAQKHNAPPIETLDLQITCDPIELQMLSRARSWRRQGYEAVKVKVGVEDGLAQLTALAQIAHTAGLQLRLDANGTWGALSHDALAERLALCASLGVQWVEDPTPVAQWPQVSPVALAHDLIDSTPEQAMQLIATRRAHALVLKPALCGSLAAARQLAIDAHAAGAMVVASSCFDSPLGLALLAAVAASWGIPLQACGLATHLGLHDQAQWGPLEGLGGTWGLRALWPSASASPGPGPGAWPSFARAVKPRQLAVIDLTDGLPQRWTQSAWQRGLVKESWYLNRLAQRHPGLVVAGQHESSAASVLRVLACLRSGVAWLPIHPRWTAGERDALLQRLPQARLLPLDADWSHWPGRHPLPAKPSPLHRADFEAPIALWLATSGTTGRPKLVGLGWPALAWSAAATVAALDLPDRAGFLLCLPVCHIAGLQVALRAVWTGGQLVIAPAADPEAQLQAIVRYQLSAVSLVPTQLARWLQADAGLLRAAARHLRAVLVGGAGAAFALLQQALAAGLPIRTTYAMTETAGTLALGEPAAPPQPGLVCGGRPLPGVELRIQQADGQAIGDVQVRSPGLLQHYLDTPLPQLGDGWWPTGDRGLLDAGGNLWLAARQSERIVRGGENVDPLEVEQVLPTVASVLEWAVVPQPHEQLGAVPLLVVVVPADTADWPAPPALLQPIQLPQVWQDALRLLAPFKRPVSVLVQSQPLPRTALGKLQRLVLAHQAEQTVRLLAPPRVGG